MPYVVIGSNFKGVSPKPIEVTKEEAIKFINDFFASNDINVSVKYKQEL